MVSEYALDNDPEKQLQQACAELSRRLRAGEDCRAESFFDSHPALASHVDYALELILAEFTTRQELGHPFDPADWYARFPQWREALERRFRLHKVCCDSAPPDSATVERTPPTTPRSPAATGLLMSRFGQYDLVRELGRGGMGVVYEAWDTVLQRRVALKVIRVGLLAGADEVERFYREARAAARLSHPHIVALHEIDQRDGWCYFTMALAPGGSLAQQRDRFTADPRATAALMEKLARAVHYAHTKDILHRDLKPGNVLLDERGEPLVADFGLAKLLDAEAELTQSGQLLGTPAYMAPELVASPPIAATVQSDVWALGVILFELLTGQRPFPGKGVKEVTQQILSSDTPRPRALQSALNAALETIVLKCLEKTPARRYASAEALADDLGRWLRGEPLVARPEGWPRKAWRALRRHWLASLAAFLLGLAVLAVPIAIHLADPERQRRAIERRLAEGEAVTLIGETGPPEWSRTRAGQVGVIPPRSREGLFTVNALQLGLLEVVANPQQAYRFSAEVRHNRGARTGEVGLYFACSKHPTPQGEALCFCTLTYSDKEALFPRSGGKPQSRVLLRLYRRNGPHRIRKRAIASHPFDLDLVNQVGNLPWRRLEVVVTDQAIQCFWNGAFVFSKTRTELKETFQDLQRVEHRLDECPDLQPRFTCRDGLGLYVCNAEASFRWVRVSPLRD